MATVTSLNAKDTVADPLRVGLAHAIDDAREAREAVERHRAAIERTRSSLRVAEKTLTVAEKGVEEARAAHAQALADAAASDTTPPASGVQAARQLIVLAQDEIEALKGALAQLRADLPAWENAVREADIAVEAAISAVLAVKAQQVLDKAREIARGLSPLRNALAALLKDHPSGAADYLAFERGRKPLAETQAAVAAFFQTINAVDNKNDTWKQAREALREDAQAPFPEMF
jgi:hypothetical protein